MAAVQESTVNTFTQSDGYVTHYRRWGPPTGDDVIVLLHGAMSHSDWLAPLGEALVADSTVSLIATDRRGSGRNEQARGHLASEERVIEDVVEFLQESRDAFRRVHLAGWCFGGQVASVAAAQIADQGLISSLLLVAPGFYFGERYHDVLLLSIGAAFDVVNEFQLSPESTRAFIPIPLQVTDFTTEPDWQQFIADDPLRLTKVTASTVAAWGAIAYRAEQEFTQIGDIPVLAVLGTHDRLIDVERVRSFVLQHEATTVHELATGHAVQFEQPAKLAESILSFLRAVGPSRSLVEQDAQAEDSYARS